MSCVKLVCLMNDDEIIKNFKDGKVGIFPTDTAFGMGCRIDEVSAIERIYKIRNRPEEKALIALVSSVEMAEQFVTIPREVKVHLIEKYWPGGLTIILNCYQEKIPSIVRANGPTLAVRWPDQRKLCRIIEGVGVPIVAPSANFSGKKTPLELNEVDKNLLTAVDFVVSGVCTIKGVSTIIDATVTPWKIVREGVVSVKSQ